jgi:mRNA interferase MazF
VWDVDFDPPTGAEIGKTRPAVVMSEDALGRLPLRIVVPITEWDSQYSAYPWFVQITPTSTNGLRKESGADAFQVKRIDHRFRRINDNPRYHQPTICGPYERGES